MGERVDYLGILSRVWIVSYQHEGATLGAKEKVERVASFGPLRRVGMRSQSSI